GPPIVAVPGLSSNASFYVGVAERLAGRRSLLSVDLRGRGHSPKPAEGYGMAAHADDLVETMDVEGVGRAVVVGHSMGAGVATVLAHRHPDRCAGVVLFDGGLQVFHGFFARPELAAEFLESAKGIEGRLHTDFADAEAYRKHWASLDIFTDDEWGPWVDAYLEHDLGEDGRVRCLPAAVAADALDLLQTARDTSDEPVAVPVLALHATEGILHGTSPLVQPETLERMRATHPAFHAVEVANTNHYTIALTDHGATTVADALAAHAERCGA
ncbi:MAG: alpha/beta fold hydrolase, partial [Acidimicrobiales bacterium]